jgi:long-chain fatty acid transport protein
MVAVLMRKRIDAPLFATEVAGCGLRRVMRAALIAIACGGVFVPATAFAGGYFIGPIGGKAIGRAGAFTAKANDLSAAFYNPAGFAHLGSTTLQLDNKFAYNDISFQREPFLNADATVTTFSKVENTNKFQPLDPLLGIGTTFGLRDFAFAFVAYANSGISSLQFPADGAQRYMMIERDAMFINYTANIAWKPISDFAIGVSAQAIVVPSLTYKLAINGEPGSFLSDPRPDQNEGDLISTIEATDMFTFNAIVGAWYRVSSSFELGLSGQVVPSKIEAEGPINLKFVDLAAAAQDAGTPALTDPFTYRESDPTKDANDITLTLPLPLTARLGGRYISRRADGTEAFDVELDVSYETWSSVDKLTMDSRGLVGNVTVSQFDVGVINVDKQWQDVFGVSLGGDFNVVPAFLDLRAGAYYETAVSKPDYANVDFVTGQQIGGTLGSTFSFGNLQLSLAYEYRFQPTQKTTIAQGKVRQISPLQPDNTLVVNAGSYDASAHCAAVGLNYKF